MHFINHRWPVFYQDNHILSLYKPAGLLMQGDRSGSTCLLDLARSWIKTQYHKPGRVFLGMVHRLDRPVAGIVVFARTSKAASRISSQIREGRLRKRYLAVLEGRPASTSEELCHFIQQTEGMSRINEEEATGVKEARLSYRVLENDDKRTLVEINLVTGRKHQIRLQFAHIGCPVLGDVRYGASAPLSARQIALFSQQIEFQHPTRPDRILLTSPLPKGWPWKSDSISDISPPWVWEEFQPSPTAG